MKRSWSGFVTSLAFDVSWFTTASTATAALASNVANERTYTSRDDELELSPAHKTLRETQIFHLHQVIAIVTALYCLLLTFYGELLQEATILFRADSVAHLFAVLMRSSAFGAFFLLVT